MLFSFRRHSGEKRFSCLVCNKMYSGSYDLRKHLKKSHPNISKNIKPNVPLTPQILANISVANETQMEKTEKEATVTMALSSSCNSFQSQSIYTTPIDNFSHNEK